LFHILTIIDNAFKWMLCVGTIRNWIDFKKYLEYQAQPLPDGDGL